MSATDFYIDPLCGCGGKLSGKLASTRLVCLKCNKEYILVGLKRNE